MEDLFSIGELSRYQNISRQTLIFYDKIGLFCPAYVDPHNGYRYYSASQIDYLDTILIMKKIGFSLDEIKEQDVYKRQGYECKWATNTVVHLLENREYTGCLVNFKTEKPCLLYTSRCV